MSVDIVLLFKCLADKSRLQIIKSLAKEEMYVERLAERLNSTPPTISFHLKKLESANIVTSRKEQYYTIYSLNKDVLKFNALDMILSEVGDSQEDERDIKYRNKVLSSFMEYGKLKSIPAQQKKKIIILEEIAKSFETNREYTEREVNIIIADVHDDFCTIRRDMVDFGIFVRDKGIYQRKV